MSDDAARRAFDGKVALVTGAGHGMARATALLFARRGAHLGLTDANDEELAVVADECRALGASVVALPLDQASSEAVNAAIRAIHDAFGRIDLAAHVAGIYPGSAIVDATDEHWALVLGTNLTGTFNLCRAVIPLMRAQGGGAIVNVASPAAFRASPGLGAYSASKAGIVALTRTLAVEAAPVRVNVVSPGATARHSDAGAAPDLAVPLGRMAYPDEVAEAICWLLSDHASYVTGQVLHLDGGGSVL